MADREAEIRRVLLRLVPDAPEMKLSSTLSHALGEFLQLDERRGEEPGITFARPNSAAQEVAPDGIRTLFLGQEVWLCESEDGSIDVLGWRDPGTPEEG